MVESTGVNGNRIPVNETPQCASAVVKIEQFRDRDCVCVFVCVGGLVAFSPHALKSAGAAPAQMP